MLLNSFIILFLYNLYTAFLQPKLTQKFTDILHGRNYFECHCLLISNWLFINPFVPNVSFFIRCFQKRLTCFKYLLFHHRASVTISSHKNYMWSLFPKNYFLISNHLSTMEINWTCLRIHCNFYCQKFWVWIYVIKQREKLT